MVDEKSGQRDQLGAQKTYSSSPSNHDRAHDEETAEPSEQERILQDSIIGQKATTEGTVGTGGKDVPTGEAAREGHGKGQG